jgi:hypothetical protein
MTLNVRVALDLCEPVLVDEPSLLGRNWFAAAGADDLLRLSEKHICLRLRV